MSDMIRIGVASDHRVRLARCLPRVTAADLDEFDRLIVADSVLTDAGAPHPALLAWVSGILRRRGGAEPVPAVLPVAPRPAPAGALVGGVA